MEKLTKEQIKRMTDEYIARQKAHFEKSIARRVERYSENLEQNGAQEQAVMIKRMELVQMREEIKDRREKIAALKAAIKALRPHRTSKKVEQAEAAKAAIKNLKSAKAG